MKAALLISHGSRSREAHDEIVSLSTRLKEKSGLAIFRHAFLEADAPNIPEGIEQCVQDGASEIIILPHFLNSGNHVLKDIPSVVQQAQKKYPNVKITIKPFIGSQPGLTDFFLDLLQDRAGNKSS